MAQHAFRINALSASFSPTPTPLRWLRQLRLGLHLLHGLMAAAFFYPLVGDTRRYAFRQRWSRKLLCCLNLKLEAQGEKLPKGSLIVANHISWIDVFVINALQPVAFVSKAEVRAWPFFGFLAARNDTIFLRRGSRGHARLVNAEIASVLQGENCAAVFPEGTTTDGSQLLHFHAALLQPAIAIGQPVAPVALSYHWPDGTPCMATAYVGETSFGECLQAMLACREMRVRAHVLPALATDGSTNRREIAHEARGSIARQLGIRLESNQPE